MKAYLKLLENETKDIEDLKKAINEIDLDRIDILKSNLLKKKFDLILNEEDLPKEFNDYVVPYEGLEEKYDAKLNSLIKKAKKIKKDILVIWGN